MAFGSGTISNIGGAVQDLFNADASRSRAKGNRLEQANYLAAAGMSDKNAAFAQTSADIKEAQLTRSIYQTIGGQQADVAGAGFTSGGSAIDLLRDSAAQGALTQAVGEMQGLIDVEGYKVQASSYRNMAEASRIAADAQDQSADRAWITAGLKGAAALASLIPGSG